MSTLSKSPYIQMQQIHPHYFLHVYNRISVENLSQHSSSFVRNDVLHTDIASSNIIVVHIILFLYKCTMLFFISQVVFFYAQLPMCAPTSLHDNLEVLLHMIDFTVTMRRFIVCMDACKQHIIVYTF